MNRGAQAGLARAKQVLAGFTPGQRGVVAVAVLALALGAFALTRWVAQPAWGPLYGNLDLTDSSAVTEQLQAQGVQYKLADGGATVLVPQSQVYDLRVSLSGKGLPASTGQGGYSLLDQQGITATDFQQNVAYRRALEGELSKTLGAIDGVRVAVVHLALPKKDVFATEADTPTASVLLSLQPGTTLDSRQVMSVTHLVAGSVEGLSPDDVTVSDSTGRMLSVSGTGAGGGPVAGDNDSQTAQYEQRLGTAVQDMLDQVLGAGNAVVRVNALLDYDATDTTTERYLTETAPPLSEATVKETYAGNGAGAGGTLGQTGNVPAVAGTGGSYGRDQRTVNNAVGKVVERSQAAPGKVDRLTVAVAVNAAAKGAVSPADVQALVSNAVGLDAARGDAVQVTKLPFDTAAADAAAKELAAAEAAQKTAGYLELGKKAGLALLVLVVGLVMFLRRRKGGSVEASASDLPYDDYYVQQPLAALGSGEQQQPALPSAEQTAFERDKVRDEVSALVDSQPEDVAAVIQGWLNERQTS